MSGKAPVLTGIVRDGVIVFKSPHPLPDGTEVEFTVTRHVFTPEEQAEWEAWEGLSNDAWAIVLDWEAEEAAKDDRPHTESP